LKAPIAFVERGRIYSASGGSSGVTAALSLARCLKAVDTTSAFAKRSAGAIAERTRDQARRVETRLYRGSMRSTPGAVFGGILPKMAHDVVVAVNQ